MLATAGSTAARRSMDVALYATTATTATTAAPMKATEEDAKDVVVFGFARPSGECEKCGFFLNGTGLLPNCGVPLHVGGLVPHEFSHVPQLYVNVVPSKTLLCETKPGFWIAFVQAARDGRTSPGGHLSVFGPVQPISETDSHSVKLSFQNK